MTIPIPLYFTRAARAYIAGQLLLATLDDHYERDSGGVWDAHGYDAFYPDLDWHAPRCSNFARIEGWN